MSAVDLLEKMDRPWGAGIIGSVLRGAADLIDRVGWCQHTAMNEARNVCAQQAITQAACDLALKDATVMEIGQHKDCANLAGCTLTASFLTNDVGRVLGRFLYEPYVVQWNDADGRTADEVTGSMRKCADHIDPPK